jgi:glucose/arabinose dehydrogenase
VFLIAVTFTASVAIALILYGGVDYIRRSERYKGVPKVAAGGILSVYLLVFHIEMVTQGIPRELIDGALVSKAYVVLPAVVGFIGTDYLLRRIVPLIYRVIPDDTPPESESESTASGDVVSRRAVLGGILGGVTVSLAGGLTVVRDALGSPTPEANEDSEFQLQRSFEAPRFPTAMSFTEDGDGFVTTLGGKIFRFERPSADQESLEFTQVASGIVKPQGIEVVGDTLYTVDNGESGQDKSGGYEEITESNGTVVAFDIEDGSLTNRRTVVSGLPVVNRDHALHQIVTGPDDRLYLSIGHLGGNKYPEELFDGKQYVPSDEDHPNHEYLGTVISFEQDGSDIEIVASGMRNVYDIAFDQDGDLYGADNNGMSRRSKVWSALYHIAEGAHFGYPEYGTFDSGPSEEELHEPLWILEGLSPTGIETTDKIGDRQGVVVGLIGQVVFVPIEKDDDRVFVPEFLRPEPTIIELTNRPMIVEAGPDGNLWVGSTGINDTLSIYTTDS